MTTVSPGLSPAELQQAARDHLWLHFTRMGGYRDAEVPIIVRGEGCYLEDANGKRYLDALAGLFAVQHRLLVRRGDRARRRSSRCASCPSTRTGRTRTRARSSSRREVALARARRPEPRLLRLRRLRRRSSRRGSSRASTTRPRRARRSRTSRRARHARRRAAARCRRRAGRRSHGTSPTTARRWARSRSTASRRCARRSSRSCPRCVHVRNTNRYHRPPDETEEEFTALPARRPRADDRGDAGPETVAMVHHGAGPERRRRVHAAGRLLARRARALRPLRDPALRRRGDHRLRPRSAPGSAPSATTSGPTSSRCAKGLSSAYAVDRRGHRDRPRDGAVPRRARDVRARDHVRRPSGACAAIALKNIEIMKRERIVEHVAAEQGDVRDDARAAARAADRRRPPRDGLLLRARARQGQGDARDVRGRGVRDAAARLPHAAAVRAPA